MTRYNESWSRSFAKLVLTRVLITISQIFIGLYLMGSWEDGLNFTLQTLTLNALFYIGHERVWNFASWGRVADKNTIFKDTWYRTLYKMVTWRLFVSANNFLVPYILTGSVDIALMALSLSSIINTLIHIVVERGTNRVKWGRSIIVDNPYI